MLKLRSYLPALIFLAGCVLVWRPHSQRSVPLSQPLTNVLAGLQGFEVHDQQVGEDERRVAGMTDYVARVYSRDTTVAFSTLVSYYDHQEQGKTIHSPRNCLPGAGWEILRAGTRTLTVDGTSHVVNQYVLKNGPATAIAYYWYQGRGRVVANEYRVKWNLLRDAALLGHTEEALVRVVVPVAADGAADPSGTSRAFTDAYAVGDQIASRLVKEVARVLPGRSPIVPLT